jgi:hypothetical protein
MSHPVTSPTTLPVSSRNLFRDHAVSWCGIPDLAYAIRNSEFGNRDSGTGVQEIFMVRYFPS